MTPGMCCLLWASICCLLLQAFVLEAFVSFQLLLLCSSRSPFKLAAALAAVAVDRGWDHLSTPAGQEFSVCW